jgi:hypothetical protein
MRVKLKGFSVITGLVIIRASKKKKDRNALPRNAFEKQPPWSSK